MNTEVETPQLRQPVNYKAISLGFYLAILTSLVTLLTFAIALFTPPISGPFCQTSCISYPFTDIIARFPGDYLWMYPAMLLTILFVALLVCIHHYNPTESKVFSHIGLLFGLVSASVLLTDYFVQVSVIQPSLISSETESIAILSQYNPHGLFIALEDLGYLLMSFALFWIAPVFSAKTRLETTVRWLFILGFAVVILGLFFISMQYGIQREYRFEVLVISVNWLVLSVGGIVVALIFRAVAKREKSVMPQEKG